MASRKMTFTLPEELARQFVRHVPARERSRYLAEALNEKLLERERQLLEACRKANEDPEVRKIEEELDGITDEVSGSWNNSSTRRNLVGKARPYTRRRNS